MSCEIASPALPRKISAFVFPRELASRIIAEVAARHRVRVAELLGPRTQNRLTLTRGEIGYRLKTEYRWKLGQIARHLNRNHATIGHAIAVYCRANGIACETYVRKRP